MINLLKKYKWFLIIGAIPYIAYVLFMSLPIKYEAYLPGEITEINNVIEVDTSYEKKGTYNSTSVYGLNDITLFQKVIFSSLNNCIVRKEGEINSSLTDAEQDMRGIIEHDASITYSIITAYNKAGIALDYKYTGMYVYYENEGTDELKIGDVILGDDLSSIKKIVEEFSPNNEIKILRNGTEMTVKPTKIDDLVLKYDYYTLGDAAVDYKIHYSSNQGPSAGFMQTLALYDDLVPNDYTNGLKIAGTGTMKMDEKVGSIGAVGIKIFTAYYDGADVFLAPKANEEEALEAYRRLRYSTGTKMKLYIVETLDEAIMYLGGLSNE